MPRSKRSARLSLSALRRASGVILVVLLAGCGSSATHSTSTRTGAAATASAAGHATATAGAQPSTAAAPQASAGSLPQTSQLPSASTAGFSAEMAALWQGIRSGSVSAAMPAFFPEGAYAQVKAIADPQADYDNRLVHEFGQDIAAAHGLLGAGASSAQLVAVQVPSTYAHWVSPGACSNRVGYYEVPNARVVYRAGGQTSSLGIASLISWRGVW